jgi:hypothetical protein
VFVEQKQAACAYINFKKRPINYSVAQMGQKSNIKLSSFYTTLQQCFARRSFQLKGVIQSKKTFDMCYQTLREPHRHQQN